MTYDNWKTTNPADATLGPDPEDDMTVPTRSTSAVPVPAGDIMESLLLKGDLAKLTPQERVLYYNEVCKSVGLNPLTKPFEYITLNSKLTLYALRSCTDQLRKINGVSLEIVSRDVQDDILTVHVRAKTSDGRVDEDLGAVPFPATLKGDARANMELKCITKAKRRATLSICGLGWLDETEVESIPDSAPRRAAKPPANPMSSPTGPLNNIQDLNTGEVYVKKEHRTMSRGVSVAGGVAYDANTGEVYDEKSAASHAAGNGGQPAATQPAAEAAPAPLSNPEPGAAPAPDYSTGQDQMSISDQIQAEYTRCANAAAEGMEKLKAVWNTVPPVLRSHLEAAKERKWKPQAREVDAEAQLKAPF